MARRWYIVHCIDTRTGSYLGMSVFSERNPTSSSGRRYMHDAGCGPHDTFDAATKYMDESPLYEWVRAICERVTHHKGRQGWYRGDALAIAREGES